jgi:hypothetical protein
MIDTNTPHNYFRTLLSLSRASSHSLRREAVEKLLGALPDLLFQKRSC